MNRTLSYYIVDGSEHPLQRHLSSRLVVPTTNAHHRYMARRLPHSSQFAVATTVPNLYYIVVYGDAAELDELRHDPDVHCTRSAFIDSAGHELFLTNEILVRFTPTTDDLSRRNLCRKFNCRVIDDSREIWRLRVLDTDDDAPLDAANHFATAPEVEFAEPNALQAAINTTESAPSDIRFNPQLHLPHTSQVSSAIGSTGLALSAWDINLDSFDTRHPDLSTSIDLSRIFDHDDTDVIGHVTSHGVAGVDIRARGGNEEVVGTAPGCRIVPLRAAGAHTWSVWAETIEWAVSHGDIICCPWTLSPSNILSEAIRRAARDGRNGRGIPIFCTTGHDRLGTIAYPSSLPATIAVIASPNQNRRSGDNQPSLGIDFIDPSCGDTSSDTPQVAEVAALMLSANQSLTADEVRGIMRDTCNPIDAAHAHYDERGWSFEYGYGRVNAAAALQRAQELGGWTNRASC